MKIKKNAICLLISLSLFTAYGGVPAPQTHQPSIPNFMEQINFQTILLSVYGNQISGLVFDKYSDLNWNPAFILNSAENGAYLDFNYAKPTDSYYQYYHSTGSDMPAPNWYGSTHVNSLQMDPLYNFAFVKKISPKWAIGIINRSIFDYGPYRSSSNWYNYATGRDLEYNKAAYDELELKTVEVDKNQQSAWGIQTEVSLGYKINSKFDAGLKLGHYIFSRSGDLNDSRYSKHPHSFVDDYNKEELNIDGDQFEFGAGLVYHFDNNANLGFYAAMMKGKSSEINSSIDKSDNWSERDSNDRYYSIRNYYLSSNHSYSSDGISPFFTLTFQKDLSPTLVLRSFFSFRQVKNEVSGSIFSMDTSYSDQTYDKYDYNTQSSYFTRDESFSESEGALNGDGEEVGNNYKLFASLTYKKENDWSAFAALILQMQSFDKEVHENSSYYRDYNFQRYHYDPHTSQRFNSNTKIYQYAYDSKLWTAIIPVGVRANIISGFSLLIGTDLKFEMSESVESGDMLYPQKTYRRTENGNIIVNDNQTDRPETYDSTKPKEFNKSSDIHFGAFYEHDSGLKIYMRTLGDILEKNAWQFGVEYVF